ncbi:MAG: hypothetical protein EOR63_32215 [Mesorhizobium sp.]|nr:MAG: hypothetical protein EOR63_32215 [Mesorhizobium sp.]
MDDERLLKGDAWLVVYPEGDQSRLSACAASELSVGGATIAGSRVYETKEDAAEACERLAAEAGLCAEIDPRLRRISPGSYPADDVFYLVVFPSGDLGRVSVATAQWFDVQDYRLACPDAFADEEEAAKAASRIARRWNIGLDLDGGFRP